MKPSGRLHVAEDGSAWVVARMGTPALGERWLTSAGEVSDPAVLLGKCEECPHPILRPLVSDHQRRWQNRFRWWWHDESTFWEEWPDWAATPLHHLMDGPVMRVVCWLDSGHVDSSYGHCTWCKKSMP